MRPDPGKPERLARGEQRPLDQVRHGVAYDQAADRPARYTPAQARRARKREHRDRRQAGEAADRLRDTEPLPPPPPVPGYRKAWLRAKRWLRA